MKIYGMGSSRSFRAVWAAEEAGAVFDYCAVKFGSDGADGTDSEAYRQLNSQGKVPTLVDGDLVLTESGAILNYLAALNPDAGLMPADMRQRALYDQMMFFILTDLEQPLWTNGKHRFAIPAKYRVKAVLKTADWEFAKSRQALEHRLGDGEFILGDRFTMADVLLAHTLSWAESFRFELGDRCTEYKNRMVSRPACGRAQARIDHSRDS